MTKKKQTRGRLTAERRTEVERLLRDGVRFREINARTGIAMAQIWNLGVELGLWRRRARPPQLAECLDAEVANERRARADASRRRRDRAHEARMRVLEDLQTLVPGYSGVGHLLPGMRRVPEVPRRSA